MNPAIFRKNDIRGKYKQDFDLNFVQTLAKAFVNQVLKKNPKKKLRLALGHDCRLSSPEIAKELANGLREQGADVYFLGMLPSPVCFFASYLKNFEASIMVTASHNPAEFNGFKMMIKGQGVCDEEILELKKLIEQGDFKKAPSKGHEVSLDIGEEYKAFCLENFKRVLKNLDHPKKHLNIAVDCGSGVSGPLAQKILNSLEDYAKFHWLYPEPDGKFPYHHPDPSEEKNLVDLKKSILKNKCDFGMAFDGDGDRLVILDQTGRTLNGDELMFIFISDFLKTTDTKFSVVADVKCADWFFDFLKRNKLPFTIAKSGHSLIRRETLKRQALFGGEVAGHYYFGDSAFLIDDGIEGLLRLISICLKNKCDLQSLMFKRDLYETPEIRLPITDESKAQKTLEKIKAFYQNKGAECLFIDGVRVSFAGKAWGLARFSNTQSEWTLRFGGSSQKNLEEIQKEFYQLINRV